MSQLLVDAHDTNEAAGTKAIGMFLESLTDKNVNKGTLELCTEFVDNILSSILEIYGVEKKLDAQLAGSSSCIFEFFHSRAKLLRKEKQLKNFLAHLESIYGKRSNGEVAIILSYLLQGRDPLIGAFCAFLSWLSQQSESAREIAIQQARARELFWRTSPVNYIGRVATVAMSVGNIEVHPGDQMLLMLPWASNCLQSVKSTNLAFGAGTHICAGQGLALKIGEHWLEALRHNQMKIDWGRIRPLPASAGVFRAYQEVQN